MWKRTWELVGRFWDKVDTESDAPCHRWIGKISPYGYGRVSIHGKEYQAHRLSYWIAHDELPEGLDIHHTCNNRWCVNSEHLQAVTRSENLRARPQAVKNPKTHCKRGHPFDEVNTRYFVRGDRTYRQCRECANMHGKKFGDKKRRAAGIPRRGEVVKTHCPQGHEYTPENIYWQKGRGGKPVKVCRICRRESAMKQYWKQKGIQ